MGWCIHVRVNIKLFAINAFYRPPIETAEKHNEFLETADLILSNLSKYKADTKLIASDLKFGNSYCKPLDISASDLFASHGFSQLIDILTRVTKDTISLLDLSFTSNSDNIKKHGTLPRIADHDGVFVSFKCSINKS